MPDYEVLIFGGLPAPSRVNLDFDSDDDAIASVSGNIMGHLAELWDGDRLVKRFEAEPRLVPLKWENPDDPP